MGIHQGDHVIQPIGSLQVASAIDDLEFYIRIAVPAKFHQFIRLHADYRRIDLHAIDLPAQGLGGLRDSIAGNSEDENGGIFHQGVRYAGIDPVIFRGSPADRIDDAAVLI